MSQFYDQASLVMVPSGYKAGKVYSQKPLSTSGELSFSRASTATRVNASGLIESVASNVPRLDYSGGASCPSLLLEPQRTNLANWSEQADQYTKVGATIGSNVVTSPDGYTNADSIIEDASNGAHAFYNFSLTTFTTSAYTASVFAKKGSRDWFALQLYHGSSHVAYFNLNTGVVGTVAAGATATITNYGNGWYRCTITATTTANAGGIAMYAANADNSISYTGTNGLTAGYFYGWQLELGAFVTSYVNTLSSAVTRVADAAYKTGISSLIGQTEGVAFIDFVWNGLTGLGSYPRVIELWSDSSNYIQLFTVSGSANIYWDLYVGGATQASGNAAMALGRNKIAVAYKTNDFAIYKNGTLIASDTSCTVPATSSLGIAGSYIGSGAQLAASVNQTLLFKTRLSNADLATLTTL